MVFACDHDLRGILRRGQRARHGTVYSEIARRQPTSGVPREPKIGNPQQRNLSYIFILSKSAAKPNRLAMPLPQRACRRAGARALAQPDCHCASGSGTRCHGQRGPVRHSTLDTARPCCAECRGGGRGMADGPTADGGVYVWLTKGWFGWRSLGLMFREFFRIITFA